MKFLNNFTSDATAGGGRKEEKKVGGPPSPKFMGRPNFPWQGCGGFCFTLSLSPSPGEEGKSEVKKEEGEGSSS